jgi:hypothetical protein
MKKVKFSFNKEVEYWHPENGAGVRSDGTMDMTRQSNYVDYMDDVVVIKSVDEIQEKLIDILDTHDMPTDYFSIMDDGRISFNRIEDSEGNYVKDIETEKQMSKNGEQLYLADYDVYIEILDVFAPSMQELKEIFPNAEM